MLLLVYNNKKLPFGTKIGFGEEIKMLFIIINWVYVILTTFGLGVGFAALAEKGFHYRIKRLNSLLMAGLVIATVYAQFFSLVTKVGLAANVILLAVCGLIVVLCRCKFAAYIKGAWKETSIAKKILVAVLVLLWAYFTSRGYMHYDSDLYHGQSIRWMEEYGVVPGLGNLHERFAYNSSFFAVSALYSLRFMLGHSMHAMSGYFALLLSITALDIAESRKRKKFLMADFARVGAIYYLTTIINEVVAPASDYSIMCVLFFIVIKWLDALAKEEQDIAPYALLCVVGVYALTLKLTAGLILLLLIKPAYLLIKEKRVKEIFAYLGMGLLVAIPWFARTVVISGWLLYPFPALDLFRFDWEMNAELIAVDAAQISAWGKALYDVNLLDTPVWVWLPNWFRTTLSGMEKLLILGNVACIGLFMIGFVWMLVKKRWQHLDMALVLGTMICSYAFWQLSAPLMRYGYAHVLLLNFLTVGWILIKLGWKPLESVVYFALLLYGGYKLFTVGEYISGNYLQKYYVWQQDYGVYELESVEIDGVILYQGAVGDRTGYASFPSVPTLEHVRLRGDGLEDGFYKELP